MRSQPNEEYHPMETWYGADRYTLAGEIKYQDFTQ